MKLRPLSPRALQFGFAAVLALSGAVALGRPAAAQVTMNADAGFERMYKSQRWVPVQVTLTNAGKPARVEVRARFSSGESPQEYRIPERTVPSNANETHTLCIKAPYHYSAQPITLDLYSDGRLINTVRASTALCSDGDWLVLGIGAGDTLKLLTAATMSKQQTAPYSRNWGGNSGNPVRINVALQEPRVAPDRWQAYDPVDMVVLGNVSERDLTPEQQSALRDWVNAGGTLVITGGPNWNRLATPFFQELLPVEVTGSQTVSGLPAFVSGSPSPSGAPAILTTSRPKPGAEVRTQINGAPLIADGAKGSGRVIFMAFDPTAPPFRDWRGATPMWKETLQSIRRPRVIPAIELTESADDAQNAAYQAQVAGQNGTRLADAPYAIPQLDIPSFYLVALFLLAYIVVLVPANYFFLKARDKKEYAWLTTPAIVAVFSLGAYGIGYGFKGGRTLLVKVGVVEAQAGQDSAPSLVYAGLFSPSKSGYDIRPVLAGSTQPDSGILLSDPNAAHDAQNLRVLQDDTQRLEDFGVDMWAMRMVKAEGMVRLKSGVTATYRRQGRQLSGSVTNNSPYTLDDCLVMYLNQTANVGQLKPGQTLPFTVAAQVSGSSQLTLNAPATGSREEQRMKQSVIGAVSSHVAAGQFGSTQSGPEPLLLGWMKEPVSPLLINGGTPRELSTTLMVVHLGKS